MFDVVDAAASVATDGKSGGALVAASRARRTVVGPYATEVGALTGDQTRTHRLARIAGGVHGEQQQGVKGGHGPPRGPRVGDRTALTVISLTLDEVDATSVLTDTTKLGVRRELSPTSVSLPKESSAAG